MKNDVNFLLHFQYELNGNARSKLKLGMYSDVTKFPHSGGYVWISEANANRLTSVFRGSIFEASNHEPVVVLKLLYHWSCQTNVTVSFLPFKMFKNQTFYNNIACQLRAEKHKLAT